MLYQFFVFLHSSFQFLYAVGLPSSLPLRAQFVFQSFHGSQELKKPNLVFAFPASTPQRLGRLLLPEACLGNSVSVSFRLGMGMACSGSTCAAGSTRTPAVALCP